MTEPVEEAVPVEPVEEVPEGHEEDDAAEEGTSEYPEGSQDDVK